jgi:hypothetical protein
LAQVISRDLQNRELTATFKTIDSFEFQDSIGDILLQICKVSAVITQLLYSYFIYWHINPLISSIIKAVPRGVLVFLSSYALLEKLERRWKSTQLWASLQTYKVVVTESRGYSKVLLSW